jgi:hypothetical protein
MGRRQVRARRFGAHTSAIWAWTRVIAYRAFGSGHYPSRHDYFTPRAIVKVPDAAMRPFGGLMCLSRCPAHRSCGRYNREPHEGTSRKCAMPSIKLRRQVSARARCQATTAADGISYSFSMLCNNYTAANQEDV